MKKPYKKPNPGDRVEIRINNKTEQGTLLDSYDSSVLLLKLDNGYNIGFNKKDISELKIVEKAKEDKKEKDENEKEFKQSGQKPIIDIILTGGTIASKLDSKTGGVKPLTSAYEFFKTYPEIFEIADIRIKNPFMKWSENMHSGDWMRIAREVGKSLNDKDVKGVIVSHGTDFLHYTGAALSFMLKDLNKPVVLTYSQRSSDRGSSDTHLNLVCSAYAALSDIAEVMLVGHGSINDDFCYALQGNKSRKMHTSRRDTFKPINCKPYAKIFANGKIDLIRNDYNKRNKNKVKIDAVFEPRVALIKFYPGQDPKILDYYRKKGYKGLIIEFAGLGQIASEGKFNFIPELKKVIDKGMIVCATAQTVFGRLDPYVYESARRIAETGVIYLSDMLSETAFVKLGWVLAHKEYRGKVMAKHYMLQNINKEFNERLGEEFLE